MVDLFSPITLAFWCDILVLSSSDLSNVLDAMRPRFKGLVIWFELAMELIFQVLRVLKKVVVCDIVLSREESILLICSVEQLLL